jgi:hypothetical protein
MPSWLHSQSPTSIQQTTVFSGRRSRTCAINYDALVPTHPGFKEEREWRIVAMPSV